MSQIWPAAACTCLTVALYVGAPGQVSLTTQDRVRIDRVAGSGLERHGDLLPAGTNAVRLERGTYLFRTGHDAEVDLTGSPDVRVAAAGQRDKDDPPEPDFAGVLKGDGVPDRVPALTVRR
jgi:hypothetical protein